MDWQSHVPGNAVPIYCRWSCHRRPLRAYGCPRNLHFDLCTMGICEYVCMSVKSVDKSHFIFLYRSLMCAGPELLHWPVYTLCSESYVKILVNDVEDVFCQFRAEPSTDWLYTSNPPARWLLEKKVTCKHSLILFRQLIILNTPRKTKCKMTKSKLWPTDEQLMLNRFHLYSAFAHRMWKTHTHHYHQPILTYT